MTSVMVFIQHNGLLLACKVVRTQDGCYWLCANCDTTLMRASFGVLNGLTRCTCGDFVELIVDGKTIDIEELNVLGQRSQDTTAPQPQGEFDEATFLRECGIATQEEEPC